MANTNVESVTWESRETIGNHYRDRARVAVTESDNDLILETRMNSVKVARLIGVGTQRRNVALTVDSDDGTAGTNPGHIFLANGNLGADTDVLLIDMIGV